MKSGSNYAVLYYVYVSISLGFSAPCLLYNNVILQHIIIYINNIIFI